MMRERVLIGAALLALAGGAGVVAVIVPRPDAHPVLRTMTLGTDPTGVTIDPRTGRVFVVDRAGDSSSGAMTGGGVVRVLAPGSRRILRTIVVGPDPRTVVVDARGGRVFVPNDDDSSVSVLDLRSGALMHTTRVGDRPHTVAVDAQTGQAFVVNSGDGTVSVLDAHRDGVRHTIHLPTTATYQLDSAVVDAQAGRVFIAGPNAVYVLDARRTTVLQTIALPENAGDGRLYLADDARSQHLFIAGRSGLRIVDARSGRLLRAVALSWQPTAIAVDAARGRVYVTTAQGSGGAGSGPAVGGGIIATGFPPGGRGYGRFAPGGRAPVGAGDVRVFDARSGTLLRTIPVGVAPSGVATDAQTGQVVVVSRGGTIAAPDPWSWVPDGLRRWLPFLGQGAQTRTVPASVTVLDPAT